MITVPGTLPLGSTVVVVAVPPYSYSVLVTYAVGTSTITVPGTLPLGGTVVVVRLDPSY